MLVWSESIRRCVVVSILPIKDFQFQNVWFPFQWNKNVSSLEREKAEDMFHLTPAICAVLSRYLTFVFEEMLLKVEHVCLQDEKHCCTLWMDYEKIRMILWKNHPIYMGLHQSWKRRGGGEVALLYHGDNVHGVSSMLSLTCQHTREHCGQHQLGYLPITSSRTQVLISTAGWPKISDIF